MKRILLRLVLFAGALAVVGFLVAASGIIPLAASAGHWDLTEWFLQFSKQRSVATHSLPIETPPLDDRRLVVRGATHYETGCRPCHGAPGTESWEPAEGMLPSPSPLSLRVPAWEPRELFYIVKHGIKFTGMPAWPRVARDDEVWAMVAFMLELPAMHGDTYLRLALGEAADTAGVPEADADAPRDPVADCMRCHGTDGRGRDGAFPSLAGQSPEYLAASLRAYAQGRRFSGIMEPVAADLDEATIQTLAARFGSATATGMAPPAPAAPDSSAAHQPVLAGAFLPGVRDRPAIGSLARGAAIARAGLPDRKVPACMHCHGPSPWPRNPVYPRLSGQHADYIELQLRLFRNGLRGGTPYHPIMREIVRSLTAREIADVARYYGNAGNNGRQRE